MTTQAPMYRPRGMSDAAYEDWLKTLIVGEDQAWFAPDAPWGGRYPKFEQAGLKTCTRCGEQYAHGTYSRHVESHNDGPRTAQWREHARIKRQLAARRNAA